MSNSFERRSALPVEINDQFIGSSDWSFILPESLPGRRAVA
jgi:hypothetical protein